MCKFSSQHEWPRGRVGQDGSTLDPNFLTTVFTERLLQEDGRKEGFGTDMVVSDSGVGG